MPRSDGRAWLQQLLGPWWDSVSRAAGSAPRLALLLIVFIGLYLLLRAVLVRAEKVVQATLQGRRRMPGEQRKRIQTLLRVVRRVLFLIFWGLATVILLGEAGVNIGPILAAAGIFGLALSFGAQSLIKDLISGLFILAEDQVRIGDVAVVNGTGGVVEGINLRTIILRDVKGAVHVFPNGAITTLANLTKDWSAFVFNLKVPLSDDVDRVIEVIRGVADGLVGDEHFRDRVLAPAEIYGLDQFGDSSMVIQGRIRTPPGEQWAVGREFNRRIKQAFDAEGITIPAPAHTVTVIGPARPLAPPTAGPQPKQRSITRRRRSSGRKEWAAAARFIRRKSSRPKP